MDQPTTELLEDSRRQTIWETALGQHPWSAPTAPKGVSGDDDRDRNADILPSPEALTQARSSLPNSLPIRGHGYSPTETHILADIIPGLNASSISPNYYGFVTGGVTPAALLADHIVSAYDQNVQVHLPEHSVATDVEACSLRLLLDLFGLRKEDWPYTTFTTGATASNLLGLACGRESVLRAATVSAGNVKKSVGENGFLETMRFAGLDRLQVLSTMPHSSLGKVAGILGIGRTNVKSLAAQNNGDDSYPLRFDLDVLERELSTPGTASIVAVSCGEVNTGHFATYAGYEEMQRIRRLCDKYNAWLHVDGAFGIFARILDFDSGEFSHVRRGTGGLELADSITGDGHKLLNVPYDCGFFFCRHPELSGEVFQNPNAAYLSSGNSGPAGGTAGLPPIMSPNNIGIENSRRFRALPVYASLLAYGRDGYRDMLERQVRLARQIGSWIFDHSKYICLPSFSSKEEMVQNTFMVVLFGAADDGVNSNLAKRVNASKRIFVSGTVWQGRAACRIAISNWRVDVKRDFEIVTSVLDDAVRS